MSLLRKYYDLILSFFLLMSCFGMVTDLTFISAATPVGIRTLGIFSISMILFFILNTHYLRASKKLFQARLSSNDAYIQLCHELRNPLATLCGIAELFENAQDNLDVTQKELVSSLSSCTATLKMLISDSLEKLLVTPPMPVNEPESDVVR